MSGISKRLSNDFEELGSLLTRTGLIFIKVLFTGNLRATFHLTYQDFPMIYIMLAKNFVHFFWFWLFTYFLSIKVFLDLLFTATASLSHRNIPKFHNLPLSCHQSYDSWQILGIAIIVKLISDKGRRDGPGGKKVPLTIFPLSTFQTQELVLKTFWVLVLTFDEITWEWKAIPISSLKILKMNHDHILRKLFLGQILIKFNL